MSPIWMLLLALLQIAPRMLERRECGIYPGARTDLELLWSDWSIVPGAPPAACLLGRVEGGATIEMVMASADLERCTHERILGGALFVRPGLLSDEHLSLVACSLLDGRPDWYITVAMTGTEDSDLHICARLKEPVQPRIGPT